MHSFCAICLLVLLSLFPLPHSSLAANEGAIKIKCALENSGLDEDAAGSLCLASNGQKAKFSLRASGLDANATYLLAVNGEILENVSSGPKGTLKLRALPDGCPDVAEIGLIELGNGNSNLVLSAILVEAGDDGGGGLIITNGGSRVNLGVGWGGAGSNLVIVSGSVWSNSTSVIYGSLSGGQGDLFDLSGSFYSQVTNDTSFDLSSSVTFGGGEIHTNAITGVDYGSDTTSTYDANFAYGTLMLWSSTDSIYFTTDGSASNSVYVLDLANCIINVEVDDSTTIGVYYLSTDGTTVDTNTVQSADCGVLPAP